MSKRRHDMDFVVKKLLKLEKSIKKSRLNKRNKVFTTSSSSSNGSSSPSSSSSRDSSPNRSENHLDVTTNAVVHAEPIDCCLPPPTTAPEEIPPELTLEICNVEDSPVEDIADILGADPTVAVEYGPDINKDVATRFSHVATTGLDKNMRTELIKKNIPGNCPYIAAPQLNAEIKAAVPDTVLKRDKAIELRQKQMAAGIGCLGKIISDQLDKKDKDNELIKELMDVGRIFCDIQYSESEMRRNFALYSVRKELKDQLSTTKIDQFLFGKDFTETIKTAKAVTKSSSDLKPDAPKKPKPATTAGPSRRHLNWRARGRSRRQPMAQLPRQQPPVSQNAPPRSTSSQNYTQRSMQNRRQ